MNRYTITLCTFIVCLLVSSTKANNLIEMEPNQVIIFSCNDGQINVDNIFFNTGTVSCTCENVSTTQTDNISNHDMQCNESVDIICPGQIVPVYMGIYGTTARTHCTDRGMLPRLYLPIIVKQ